MTREHTLFFSLWALLVLLYGLWRFRIPTEGQPQPDPAPSVKLARELSSWFDSATVVTHTPYRYTVEFKLSPGLRASLRDTPREVRLGYRYLKSTSVLGHGEFRMELRDEISSRQGLPNAERVAAAEIEIFLAR